MIEERPSPNNATRRYRYLPVIILILMALSCILPIAWFAFDYFIRMPMAVRHLEAHGGYVYHDTRGITTYDDVDLSHTTVADDDMWYVKVIGATGVDLTGTEVTDEGLRHFYDRTLYALTITDTNVTDEGIAELKRHCPRCAVFRGGERIDEDP